MSKERLEEIKNSHLRGLHSLFGTPWVSIPKENFDWLIQQSERVQELEEENKRYREAIERALDESGWGDEGNALYRTIGILTKALEGRE